MTKNMKIAIVAVVAIGAFFLSGAILCTIY